MKKRTLFFIFILSYCSAQAQIAIGAVSPHASAALDITSHSKGLLIPRVVLKSLHDQVTIPSPAHSMLVFSIQDIGDQKGPGYYWWNRQSLSWRRLIDDSANSGISWELAGNAGTQAGLQFIGTTDNVDLAFKRNKEVAGLLNESKRNTSFGVNSQVGLVTTTIDNTAIGFNSLSSLSKPGSTGYKNTALGSNSLVSNTKGFGNVALGFYSLLSNKEGYHNVAIGNSALKNAESRTNVAIGNAAQEQNTTGFDNTSVGNNALTANQTGDYNTAIGANSGPKIENLSNTLSLGFQALVTESNMVRIGNFKIKKIEMQVPINFTSDRRVKEQITSLALGLDFMNKLRPVAYQRIDTDKPQKEWGLIAQELQQTLQEVYYTDAGIVQEDGSSEHMLSIRYTDLIAPMIKAIQELSARNLALEKRVEQQRQRSLQLETEVHSLKKWFDEQQKALAR